MAKKFTDRSNGKTRLFTLIKIERLLGVDNTAFSHDKIWCISLHFLAAFRKKFTQ